MLSLNDRAKFLWSFHDKWLLETEYGNYIWSDLEYGGDNTISQFNGTCGDFCRQEHIPFVRDKGKHIVREYCGPDVKILNKSEEP